MLDSTDIFVDVPRAECDKLAAPPGEDMSEREKGPCYPCGSGPATALRRT